MDDNQEEQVNATIMPVSNPYGSNMALLEHFCGQAPMDIACAEQERLAAPARTTRKRKNRDDEDVLISKGKGVDASDEDDDHIILEMEERRVSAHTPDVIPNLLEDSASGSSSGKRARSDEDVVDKHPVGRLRISAEWNGLKKLQADYDEVDLLFCDRFRRLRHGTRWDHNSVTNINVVEIWSTEEFFPD
ncbi:hypothetical protein Bca101_019008 [Brassica carinata]